MVLFLLSFLGILLVWSDILQEEGNCTKKKLVQKKFFNLKILQLQNSQKQLYGKILNLDLNFIQGIDIFIFINFLNMFFLWHNFLLSLKYRTDNMPRIESKNEIKKVNKNTFRM